MCSEVDISALRTFLSVRIYKERQPKVEADEAERRFVV